MKLSMNKLYAGVHWATRNKWKDFYFWEIKRQNIDKTFDKLDYIQFDFYLKGRLIDASNTSLMAKMIEDALIKNGILKDDSPKYYNKVIYTVNRGDNYCIITLVPKGGENE